MTDQVNALPQTDETCCSKEHIHRAARAALELSRAGMFGLAGHVLVELGNCWDLSHSKVAPTDEDMALALEIDQERRRAVDAGARDRFVACNGWCGACTQASEAPEDCTEIDAWGHLPSIIRSSVAPRDGATFA